MTALVVLLAIALIAAIVAFTRYRVLKDDLTVAVAHTQIWRDEARAEQRVRLDYEQAMGLPVTDRERLEEELWQRAADGDQLAAEIIAIKLERTVDEVAGMPSRQQLPHTSGRYQ
jgi:hypothetical protein